MQRAGRLRPALVTSARELDERDEHERVRLRVWGVLVRDRLAGDLEAARGCLRIHGERVAISANASDFGRSKRAKVVARNTAQMLAADRSCARMDRDRRGDVGVDAR